ncbi:sporulation protein YqfD [Hydrogenibacillus sp. N12]|uniref:sporulation protein YqfD n=1 Tax=Hydrogenibacillus sp. N12 TaxID=2866627 RepID=UPI001C7D8D3A|nr:sporulation protein YqfD [Hydrogenibacillus sp. N12]QZA32240.1 sporulation protein YqfD [Hydrogenibacillus sp. N12]
MERRDRLWGAYAEVRLIGDRSAVGRFLTRVAAALPLWDVRESEDGLRIVVRAGDVKKLRRPAREAGVRVRIAGRRGGAFWISGLLRRPGIIAGVFLFFALLAVLSNLIWFVDVAGVTGEEAEAVREAAAALGLKPGRPASHLPEPAAIERALKARLPWAAWVGVERTGVRVTITAVPHTVREKDAVPPPRHLVADRKAVIVDYVVARGRPVVRRGEVVEPGQVLVSGLIGPPDRALAVAADGKVYGEVWYDVQVTVTRKRALFTTREPERLAVAVALGGRRFPLYGKPPASGDVLVDRRRWHLAFGPWSLPVALEIDRFRPLARETIDISEEAALQEALQAARAELYRRGRDVQEIRAETVLQRVIEDDKVYVSVHYGVVEDIARPAPIDAADGARPGGTE